MSRASGHAPRTRRRQDRSAGVPVLDVIYLATTLALFALVGLIVKAVEKL